MPDQLTLIRQSITAYDVDPSSETPTIESTGTSVVAAMYSLAESVADSEDGLPGVNTLVKLANVNAKWRVMSSLQKAVRRGNNKNARAMCSALINSDLSELLLQRLPVIAMEDVAFGDPELCAMVFAFASSAKVRKDVGGWPVLLMLVDRMCDSIKDRIPCEIAVSSSYSPLEDELKKEVLAYDEEQLVAIAKDPSAPFNERWLCGRALSGQIFLSTAKDADTSCRSLAGFRRVFEDAPALLRYIAYRGSVAGGEQAGLSMGMLIGWDALYSHADAAPVEVAALEFEANVVRSMLVEALDMHNHEGKTSYRRLLGSKEGKAFSEWCESVGADPRQALADGVFITESKLCNLRLTSPDITRITHMSHLAQLEKSCTPAEELDNLCTRVAGMKPLLDEIRASVLTQ